MAGNGWALIFNAASDAVSIEATPVASMPIKPFPGFFT